MARSKIFLSGACVFALAAISCAVAVDGPSGFTAATGADLIGGTASNPQGTGAVFFQANSGYCTGAMIGANQILTAAHCVTSPGTSSLPVTATVTSGFTPGDSIAISNSGTLSFSGNWFTSHVAGTDVNPDWVAACSSGCPNNESLLPPYPGDLAIITLTDTFPMYFGNAAALTSANVGDTVEEVGFGCTTPGSAPSVNTFKMATATVLDPTATTNPASFSVSSPAAFAQHYYVTLGQSGGGQASLCPGDSGGPLFKGSVSNGGFLAGVNAYYTFTGSSKVSDVNTFARVDPPATTAWIGTVFGKYPTPKQTLNRGDPINQQNNAVSIQFPQSTVGLETPGMPGCTGVILSPTQILTAASCQPNPSTQVRFYPVGAGAGTQTNGTIAASSTPAAVIDPAIQCNPQITGSFPSTCYANAPADGGSPFYADLAIVTLSASITTVGSQYKPAYLPASGSLDTAAPKTSFWQLATAGGGMMVWAPTVFDSPPYTGDGNGSFALNSIYGQPGDVGGPLYAYASMTGSLAAAGVYDLQVYGILSSESACPDGSTITCDTHVNTFTSTTYGPIHDWLVNQGAIANPQVASFGAGN